MTRTLQHNRASNTQSTTPPPTNFQAAFLDNGKGYRINSAVTWSVVQTEQTQSDRAMRQTRSRRDMSNNFRCKCCAFGLEKIGSEFFPRVCQPGDALSCVLHGGI